MTIDAKQVIRQFINSADDSHLGDFSNGEPFLSIRGAELLAEIYGLQIEQGIYLCTTVSDGMFTNEIRSEVPKDYFGPSDETRVKKTDLRKAILRSIPKEVSARCVFGLMQKLVILENLEIAKQDDILRHFKDLKKTQK